MLWAPALRSWVPSEEDVHVRGLRMLAQAPLGGPPRVLPAPRPVCFLTRSSMTACRRVCGVLGTVETCASKGPTEGVRRLVPPQVCGPVAGSCRRGPSSLARLVTSVPAMEGLGAGASRWLHVPPSVLSWWCWKSVGRTRGGGHRKDSLLLGLPGCSQLFPSTTTGRCTENTLQKIPGASDQKEGPSLANPFYIPYRP